MINKISYLFLDSMRYDIMGFGNPLISVIATDANFGLFLVLFTFNLVPKLRYSCQQFIDENNTFHLLFSFFVAIFDSYPLL